MSSRPAIILIALTLVAGCEQRAPSPRAATNPNTPVDPAALAALAAARAEAEKEKIAYENKVAQALADFDANWRKLKQRAEQTVTVTRAEATKKTDDLKETILRVAGETEARQGLERAIEQLRAQTAEAAADADVRLLQAEKARATADAQLRHVRESSPEHWRTARQTIDEALDSLRRGYERALAAFPA